MILLGKLLPYSYVNLQMTRKLFDTKASHSGWILCSRYEDHTNSSGFTSVLFSCRLLFFTSILILLPWWEVVFFHLLFPYNSKCLVFQRASATTLCSSVLIIVFSYYKALSAKGQSVLITSVWLPTWDSKLCYTCPRSNSWLVCEFRPLIPGPVNDFVMGVACVLKGWALHFSSQVTCEPLESQKFSTW